MRVFKTLAVTLSLAVLGTTAPTKNSPTRPTEDAFYTPPDGFEKTAPGTILRMRSPPTPISIFSSLKTNLDSAYQLLFRSTNTFGDPIAAVTTILIPHNADYTKLLSYQVAEDAADPNCAPSYAFQLGASLHGPIGLASPQYELVVLSTALQRGWVVTVPDHLGLQSAFLANHLSGNIVLDNVRAALASSNETQIDPHATTALWGYSGGSLSSGFAAEAQPSYAPELEISGAALGGTVPNILSVIDVTNKGLFAGLIPSGVQGLANEYPELKDLVDKSLTDDGKKEFDKTKNLCLPGDITTYAGKDVYKFVKDRNVFTSPIAKKVLDANKMGNRVPEIPLLVYKAGADEVSSANETDALVDSYCHGGATVDYKRDESADHIALAVLGVPDALIWLTDRFNGKQVEKGCSRSSKFTSLQDPATYAILGETGVQILTEAFHAPIGPIQIG